MSAIEEVRTGRAQDPGICLVALESGCEGSVSLALVANAKKIPEQK